jgi:hypothetical protein
MKKGFLLLFGLFTAAAILGLISLSSCKKTTDDGENDISKQGILTQHSSGVRIVRLYGNYYEMGLQYGYLLRDDLRTWADYYNNTWKTANPLIYNFITKEILEEGNKIFISQKIKDFLAGEQLTSGMSKTDVYLLAECLAFDYMFSGTIPLGSGAACTFVGAFGSATGGHTIVARNLDLQKPLAVRDYNSVITIMHPTNGDHKVATMGFVGFPQGYALLNLDNYVFTEYNTGNSADSGTDPFPGSLDMMDVAFEAVAEKTNTDAKSTAEYIKAKKLLSPAFFGVADRNEVFVVQRPMKDNGVISQNTLVTGITGVTNVFLDSNLAGVKLTIYNASTAVDAPDKHLDTPARGMVRWVNLVSYFQQHPSGLDIEAMKGIISKNIADSGAFITGYEVQGTNTYCKSDATFGSVVIDLSDLTKVNWLRYDYSTQNKTWDVIDLTQYFKN